MKQDSTQREFVRRPSEDEFLEFTRRELERLKTSDAQFDETLYREAHAAGADHGVGLA